MMKIKFETAVRKPVNGASALKTPQRTEPRPATSPAESAKAGSLFPNCSPPLVPASKAQKYNGSIPLLAARSSSPAELRSPAHLRLSTSDGKMSQIPASNYYLKEDGQIRSEVKSLAETALARSPAEQKQYDTKQTDLHGLYEMSFRVKDSKTGNYDKIFKVPVHASPVPLAKAHFDMLIQSTGPVMRALREMLQAIYSEPDLSAKTLGIDELPTEDQERILETIKDCVYFEPKLVGPEMADYPFLPVAGFDAAVGDLNNPEPVFFEYNLGTPSGLANNIQLIENLRTSDPKMFKSFANRLPEDDTFKILKNAIDSNAKAWTKNPDGISVVIGPGTYNGAHPDVASIAQFSGMPLVNPSDLYEDSNGDIRLDMNRDSKDPVVTGIYGRMEESYFLQNNDDGVPIRGPDFTNNEEIGKKFGIELKSGVAYAFKYNEAGEVVGVRTDEAGKPQYQEVFESIQRPGSFLRAVKNRKLYYSGLGGRVVDDKRIFQAVSKYIAPKHATAGEPIARPPQTLDPSEYSKFYDSSTPEKFVVKEPDNSGGVGVHLLVNYTKEQRDEVVEMVKRDPERYIVQEFAQPAVMMCAEDEGDKQVYGSLANDWRIFSMMDASGQVEAGPNSLLLRTAKPKSASTNTSQGGGYGIGVVLGDKRVRPKNKSVLPVATMSEALGTSRIQDLNRFLYQFNDLTWAAQGNCAQAADALVLAQFQREVMDILGRDCAPLMTLSRDFAEGKVSQSRLYEKLLEFRMGMLENESLNAAANDTVRATLAFCRPAAPAQSAVDVAERSAAMATVDFQSQTPLRIRKNKDTEKYETARYKKVPHEFVQSVIDRLEAEGGEVRMIREKENGVWSDNIPSAYFRVTEAGKPIIGIDLKQGGAVSGLAHEFSHYLDWKKTGQLTQTPAERVDAEQRALDAEMKYEKSDASVFNRGNSRPHSPLQPSYINRVSYPVVEGIRDLLHRARWSGESLDQDQLATFMHTLLTKALKLRKLACEHYTAEAACFDRLGAQKTKTQSLEARATAQAFRDFSIFDSIFDPSTVRRFQGDGTFDELQTAFTEGLCRSEIEVFMLDKPDRERLNRQKNESFQRWSNESPQVLKNGQQQ